MNRMRRHTPSHNRVHPEIFINFESHYSEIIDLVNNYRNAIGDESYLSILRTALDDVEERIAEALRLKTLVVRSHFYGRNRLYGKYKRLIFILRAIQSNVLECMYDYDGN
ncbi:hypothetical protein EAE96_001896 [Botrytis aclada]|nr:hypothetical protein EAE96_001896 [Botrytis aclada]